METLGESLAQNICVNNLGLGSPGVDNDQHELWDPTPGAMDRHLHASSRAFKPPV